MSEIMNPIQFEDICSRVFGGRGWQGKIAEILGCSQSHISNMKNGKAPIPRNVAATVLKLLEGNINKVEDEVVSRSLEAMTTNCSVKETDEEILDRIADKQKAYEDIVDSCAKGIVPSVIVSGPAGIGKSYTIRKCLPNADTYSGVASAVGLYKALWYNRDHGVVVFDDCDSAFSDEDSLNILKAALDSSGSRTICWNKQSSWLENEEIDAKFAFNGSIVFLTNIDMLALVEKENKMSKHFLALMSRCLYLDLGMHSKREILLKMKLIIPSVFGDLGFSEVQQQEISDFIFENQDNWRFLSLRELSKIGQIYKTGPRWKLNAQHFLMRNK